MTNHTDDTGVELIDVEQRASNEDAPAVEPPDFDALTSSPGQREQLEKAWRMASGWRKGRCRDVPILIQGETGTGKEWLAERIHEWSGGEGAFHAINLGAINEGLADAELFGVEKGAFTGASQSRDGHLAQAGMILLDEVDKAPPGLLVKLLRTLRVMTYYRVGSTRQQEVKALIVCAASRDLGEMVAKGEMIPDFYRRVDQSILTNLPLRDRRCDIPGLARTLAGARKATIDDDAAELLARGVWGGNVASLKGAIDAAWMQYGKLTAETVGLFVTIAEDDREASILYVIRTNNGATNREIRERLGLNRRTLDRILEGLEVEKRVIKTWRNNRDIVWVTPDAFDYGDDDPEEGA